MAKYIVQERIENIDGLQAFSEEVTGSTPICPPIPNGRMPVLHPNDHEQPHYPHPIIAALALLPLDGRAVR